MVLLFQTANDVLSIQLIQNKFSVESMEATAQHICIFSHSEHIP